MSTRGVKFNFKPGEFILCFEPDLTKARVLYDAKVLDVNVARDRRGRKRVEYHIHFNGWNSSWDRIVPECYVLKDSDKNRALMKKVTDLARRMHKNKSRMRKIDNILKDHFKQKLKFDTDSESSSGNESDDDESQDDEDETDGEEEDLEENGNSKSTEDDENENGNKTIENSTDSVDSSDAEETTFNENETDEPKVLDLPLTTAIRQKLEDDCFYIRRKSKLLKLPAEVNVVTLLEGFVKNFAINILCATTEKHKPYHTRELKNTSPEKSIEVCKEVAHGMRVFFDFALPTILLYPEEREQYKKLASSATPAISPQKSQPEEAPDFSPNRLRSANKNPSSPREPSSKIPRLSPKVSAKQEFIEMDEDSDEEVILTRRVTRKAYQEEIKRGRFSGNNGHSSKDAGDCDDSDTKSEQVDTSKKKKDMGKSDRRESLRSRTGDISGSSGNEFNQKGGDNKSKSTKLADRITPPPPLLIPTTISSKMSTSSSQDTPTSSVLEQQQEMHSREVAVNDIFSWQMMPDDVKEKMPTPPSLIYGPHHFVRLFVKLPQLLGMMHLPAVREKVLYKHLDNFLQYISSRAEELLSDVEYADASCMEAGVRNKKP